MSDLIKRDDVIEALKKNCRPNSCVNYANRWCEAACPKNEIEDFINSIPAYEPEKVLIANVTFDEDKLKEIVQAEVIDKIKSGELVFKDEWIPISEKLPNRNGCYIVTRIIEGTAISDVCYFDGQNTWHRDVCVNHGRPYLTDITAWQPLPEPYKKGGVKQ